MARGSMTLRGEVRDKTPWLRVAPAKGKSFEFVVDSGYTGCLAADVKALKSRGWELKAIGRSRMTLADGRSSVSSDLHATTIDWMGSARKVTVTDKPTGDALLGYALLEGTTVVFKSDSVEISASP